MEERDVFIPLSEDVVFASPILPSAATSAVSAATSAAITVASADTSAAPAAAAALAATAPPVEKTETAGIAEIGKASELLEPEVDVIEI